mmetsp:Transcript_2852/g.6135  ORF Transcript_2852/g.6135 Transcript_2852/m.6135 type:complete len:494 (-) Transcript_2852:63-1544(-)
MSMQEPVGSKRARPAGQQDAVEEGETMQQIPVGQMDAVQAAQPVEEVAPVEEEHQAPTTRYPIGADRERRLESEMQGDMELVFLGTASCVPGVTRGVSCTALRCVSDTWLFDCGEGTQIQLQRSRIRISRVKKIFITHAHGDHSFGLPGVLCLIGQSVQTERERLAGEGDVLEPIDIYGPEGTRDLVRAVVQLSYSKIVAPHRVHELKNVPFLHNRHIRAPSVPVVRTRFDSNYGEREGSRDIYPDSNGHYHLFTEEGITVKAAPLQHTVPCVGYVVTEHDRPGSLKPELVKSVVEANKIKLRSEMKGSYLKVYGKLKDLAMDEVYTFPDGTEVKGLDIVEPPKKGRKVVFMGDTCSGELIKPLAMGADVLVHEATNAFLPEIEGQRHLNYEQLERDTIYRGHSTPQMAGRFAAAIGAGRLLMTHFSPRYQGDDSLYSMKLMWRIEDQAREASGLNVNKNDVIAAWDQMSTAVPIPLHTTRAKKAEGTNSVQA